MTRQRRGSSHAGIIHEFLAEAVRLGADTIEVEYRDGYEEVSVSKAGPRFKTATSSWSSRRSASLREELHNLQKKRTTVAVSGAEYEIRTRAHERFGETAFEVRLRRI